MTKQQKKTGTEQVNGLVQQLDHPLAALIGPLRQIVTGISKDIEEQVKWNSPAFYYTGEMKAFNAKEYKRDLLVVNLRQKDHLLLIFPTGATIPDASGLLEGDYADGRRMVKIFSMEDLEQKKEIMETVIRKWLEGIEQ